jgi:hypothetical protein
MANQIKFRRIGGLFFFRLGRFGGSFYLASRFPKVTSVRGRYLFSADARRSGC